ncbi:hypothetical protein PSTG_00222 [Puccinia striiformis f. sp. tritici PST-78]|uniref:Uncharacterized protein n=1 Tax=Puccinia striiformis f. sp. tritici PST-78 TaxID=1165861 RepID=A0A0L0W5V1_9BASI|nr:hypothetical protein PSTG_00222 [Puccinia striiformis f. sp. tritici PST-78]
MYSKAEPYATREYTLTIVASIPALYHCHLAHRLGCKKADGSGSATTVFVASFVTSTDRQTLITDAVDYPSSKKLTRLLRMFLISKAEVPSIMPAGSDFAQNPE